MSSQFAGAPGGPVQLLHWCHLCSAELLYCPTCGTYITNHTYNAQHLTSSNGWDCQTLQSELYWEAGKEEEADFSHLKSLLNQHWIHKCSSISYMPPCGFQRANFLFCSEMKASVTSKPLYEYVLDEFSCWLYESVISSLVAFLNDSEAEIDSYLLFEFIKVNIALTGFGPSGSILWSPA